MLASPLLRVISRHSRARARPVGDVPDEAWHQGPSRNSTHQADGLLTGKPQRTAGSPRLVREDTFHEHHDRQSTARRERQQIPAGAGALERRLVHRDGGATDAAPTRPTRSRRLRVLQTIPALTGVDGPVQRRSESLWPGIRALRLPVRRWAEARADADLELQ